MGPRLHWFPEDVTVSRLAAVMVGMANSAGGKVLIGITPRSGYIQGVRDPQRMLDLVFQAALLSDPPLVLPVPRVLPVGAVSIVEINIPPGLPHVYSLEGRYLQREGTQTNPLPARKLRQLLVERGLVQFEAQVPPGASLEDLNMDRVSAYAEAIGFPVQSEQDLIELLVRRGCLKRTGKRIYPTYAAILLFGRYPQQWLPSATILAARFSGQTFADQFVKEEIGGTLPEQLRRAEAFVRENLRRVVRMVGLTHEETTEVPVEAVRELLVNAVAHRDYNLQGDSVHLNLFAGRIEVHSPGGLPGPVNLQNLLEARFSRNAVIVQILSDLGFVERLGYGLDRVVTVMKQNHLRPPRFEEVAGSFRVTLYGEALPPRQEVDLSAYQDLDLNPRQEAALSYLSRHRRITNRDFQEMCPDVHPETLRRDLADLVSRNILIKVGDKKATYYVLKQPAA
ncbi:MAG: transcriptional regulator [Chloroflexi bacterium]|jgi:ATP-dependent DNA helicase RecG|nr:transcriptional regulator [Chloroflexota bacterium]